MIYIKSITKAQKALSLLQRHGIRCSVERVTNAAGCGFGLRVTDRNADSAEVCALLKTIGVDCGLSG